jgi:hypothetical protein
MTSTSAEVQAKPATDSLEDLPLFDQTSTSQQEQYLLLLDESLRAAAQPPPPPLQMEQAHILQQVLLLCLVAHSYKSTISVSL